MDLYEILKLGCKITSPELHLESSPRNQAMQSYDSSVENDAKMDEKSRSQYTPPPLSIHHAEPRTSLQRRTSCMPISKNAHVA